MCHEQRWRERRERREEESREVWLDFDRNRPADAPVPDTEPDVTRLEDEDEVITVER
jgi:hypothetical protein